MKSGEGKGTERTVQKSSIGNESTLDEEFVQLRKLYDEKGRLEAERTGLKEYVALKNSGEFPGLEKITYAIEVLSSRDAQWLRRKAPGLAKFLSERWWHSERLDKPLSPSDIYPAQGPPSRPEVIHRENQEVAARVLSKYSPH